MNAHDLQELTRTLDDAVTQSGHRLVELSERSPVLLLFLRHAGCTFCRQALADLGRARRAIAATGTRVVIVHMGEAQAIERLLKKHGLESVERIADRDQRLYRAFGLKRGRLKQLLGLRVMRLGLKAALVDRHGIGVPRADAFQMPGLFLLHRGDILGRFRHRLASDRPDYLALCLAPHVALAARFAEAP